jgi:hypothetical protein
MYEIGVQAGTAIGFWINYGVSRNMPKTSAQWITPFAVQLIPGGLLILGVFLLLESPRFVLLSIIIGSVRLILLQMDCSHKGSRSHRRDFDWPPATPS